MPVSHFAHDGHLYHTVRVAARDGDKFSATLHVDLGGQVLDGQGNVTDEPFSNGGRVCDFDRGSFAEI